MSMSVWIEYFGGLLYCQNPLCMEGKHDNKEWDLNWEHSFPRVSEGWSEDYIYIKWSNAHIIIHPPLHVLCGPHNNMTKRRSDIKEVDNTKFRVYHLQTLCQSIQVALPLQKNEWS
jgi:hypothetical protein